MNKTTSMLLSSILSTTVVTTSGKVYEDKYKTYMLDNLTQLEVMLDGWKNGYNDLNTKLINAESRIKSLEEELAKTQTMLQNTTNETIVEPIKEEKNEHEDEKLDNTTEENVELDNTTEEEVQESIESQL